VEVIVRVYVSLLPPAATVLVIEVGATEMENEAGTTDWLKPADVLVLKLASPA
jgi:hypothetical protein